MPDASWPEFAGKAVAALKLAKTGTVEIEDRQLTLKGVADDPAADKQISRRTC